MPANGWQAPPCQVYRKEYTSCVAGKRAPKKTTRAPAKKAAPTASKPKESEKEKAPRLTCRFYKSSSGNEPVREWLKELPADVRKEIGSDIQVVQWRWPIGKPLIDGFGDGLYEVRTSHDGNIYRVLFCLEGSVMVLLHGFMKKSKATPKPDIDLARKRMKDEEDES